MKGNSVNIMIPFTDLTIKNKREYLAGISRILQNGDFILGKNVDDFEKEFADYLGVKYCIGTASGTDAILLALKAIDVSRNDEIIVPAFTFVSSVTPVVILGARPVFVDIKEDLPVIDEDKIEKAITKKTRAIIAVHLYGYSCELQKIKKISRKYSIPLIEDASQAHGAVYQNKKIGTFGDLATFSFYPTKNLGAFGDAGAVVTKDKNLNSRLRMLRNHGQNGKYKYKLLGYNSRIDSIQAAILRIKLRNLDRDNIRKSKLASFYASKLKGLPVEIFMNKDDHKISVAHSLFVIRTMDRDKLFNYLKRKNILCSIHYPNALPCEKIFKCNNQKDFPNAMKFAATVLSLPFFPGMSEKQVNQVADSITSYFSNKH